MGMMLFKSCFRAILHFSPYRSSPKPVWSEEGRVGKQNIQCSCSVISYFSSKVVKYCDNPWEGSGRRKCLIPGHVLPTVATPETKAECCFQLKPLPLSCLVPLWQICICFSFIRKLPSLRLPLTHTLNSSEGSVQAPPFFTSSDWCFFCLSSYYQKNVLSCL